MVSFLNCVMFKYILKPEQRPFLRTDLTGFEHCKAANDSVVSPVMCRRAKETLHEFRRLPQGFSRTESSGYSLHVIPTRQLHSVSLFPVIYNATTVHLLLHTENIWQ